MEKPLGYSNPHRYDATDMSNGYGTIGGTMNNDTLNGRRVHQNGEMGWLNDGMEPELYNELYNYPSLGDIKRDPIEGNAQNGSWFDTDL